MKKILAILMLGGMLSCKEKTPNIGMNDEGKSLPAFNVLLMDSTTKFNIGKISNGKPTVLFFFGPDCPYCQGLSKDIIAHIDRFKNVQIFFLSASRFHDMKNYNDLFKLNKYSNITIAQDYTGMFFNYFKGTSIPYLVIYDKEKKYKQTVVGNVGADSIVNIING
jgi:thiol-disulfide isomerase/thioredoxin